MIEHKLKYEIWLNKVLVYETDNSYQWAIVSQNIRKALDKQEWFDTTEDIYRSEKRDYKSQSITKTIQTYFKCKKL